MDNFQEQMEEIKQLKAEQALHRKQLEENRQRALAKRNQTKHLVTLGKIVEGLLPEDAACLTEDEIRDILAQRINSSNLSSASNLKR
ncbi:hypothetical protein DW842_19610 [Ruminococcus sp. AM36-17]|nr:hypothetical protein DW842_19610 [Ruminococcus sp. AM36-17]